MKVLDSRVFEGDKGEAWFRVELGRNTNILEKELFTQDDIEAAKREAVKEFLYGLYHNWENNLKSRLT
jgi:hypothetical protein